ncbi:hypothetical protein EPN87_04080 [archaeon]|nr:MAG: hypothetical protein EPN87_04080 [archaeon]
MSIHSQNMLNAAKTTKPNSPKPAIMPSHPYVPKEFIMLPQLPVPFQSIIPMKFIIKIITFTFHIKLVKDFIELTENLSQIIARIEGERRVAADAIRKFNSQNTLTLSDEVRENRLIIQALPSNLEGMKLAGIDGGLVKKSFHGLDLMLLRAVGVIFNYSNGLNVDYYPESMPTPDPHTIIDPFSDIEFEINSNILRQIKEITTARETVEKYEPDIIFLNGSVIPHYTFVDKSSLLYDNYKKMIEAYQKLFDTVKAKKTILAGVIEDSRGTRFCEVISKLELGMLPQTKLILQKTKDSNLLTYALQHGDRTMTFTYSSDANHPILREFPGETIMTFYLKTSEFDRPVRIDFLADKGLVADKIASVLLALSTHAGYGMPSIIVEADQRAKLSEHDLEMFYMDILNRVGNLSGMMEQRRNNRPF